jgi:hypothetical protein
VNVSRINQRNITKAYKLIIENFIVNLIDILKKSKKLSEFAEVNDLFFIKVNIFSVFTL